MINVLSVNDYFLPGFKAGGPIRTLQNIARITQDTVRFGFLTRDHDLGDSEPYSGIHSGRWANYPQGEVFYADARTFGLSALADALSTRHVDIIYLNSFFSFRGSIEIVIGNWKRAFGIPLLLAPRGEFSPGALALKGRKKRLFLGLARMLGLYQAVWWHASTDEEKNDILRQFPGVAARIFVAEDPVDLGEQAPSIQAAKPEDAVRLVFVSRISPKKNLGFLLEVLQGVQCRVDLQIYGPIEDSEYWRMCIAMISDLPPQISATYSGELKPERVSDAFAQGDLFAFPTCGENFGHVIFEAMRAGTPVLVSDQTPWQPDDTSAVVRLPLDAIGAWRAHIESVAKMTEAEQQGRRADTLRYARRHAASEKTRMDNLRMFEEVAQRRTTKVDE